VVYIIFILKKPNIYIVEPKRIREKKSCPERIREKKSCPETSFTPFSALGKKFTFFFCFKVKEEKIRDLLRIV